MALKRYIALVIGNSQYDSPCYGNLTNPANDADAMGAVLQKLKCTIFVKKNLTYSEYGIVFDEFTQEIIKQKADAAIVYFAGHGLNIDATDYLIMKDTPAFKTGESKTKKESVAINDTKPFFTSLFGKSSRKRLYVLSYPLTVRYPLW